MDQKRLNFFFSLNNAKIIKKDVINKSGLCWRKKLPPRKENIYSIKKKSTSLKYKFLPVKINYCYKHNKFVTFSF